MLTENQYIIESFEKNFSSCKAKKIVLYGKGPYTKLILDTVRGYNIIGIMDRDIRTGIIFDKPVLSYKQVVEQGTDLIIVVSRPNSIETVFRRIHVFCSVNYIQLYGIDGENLFDKFHVDHGQDEGVVYTFEKNFASCKNKKIVLYGKGPRTRMIVEALPDYNIVGLMDKREREGIYFGKRILTYEEVRELEVDMIIAVTREHSTPHVYNRINRFCSSNHIMLYDVNGENLIEKYGKTEHYVEDDPYFYVCEESLRKAIEDHDVISFDMFDTLVMRKTFFPTDVFEIVAQRAQREGIIVDNFKRFRIKAERECVVNHGNIYDIYESLQKITQISDKEKGRLTEIEIETEKDVLIRREKIVEMFDYAISLGKKVCIISDMYLTEKILREILEGLGIKGYDKFYVSCDYCVSKGCGIFEVVKRQVSGSNYLHIGDNKIADGLCAQNSGYDTFIIQKASDMLEISSYGEIGTIIQTANERAVIGLFIAKAFNNPFALYHSEGKLEVKDSYIYGYLFIAPLVTKFMLWLISEIEARKYDDVLFSARDGYIILQLYREAKRYLKKEYLPEGIYFPTSRLLNASISRMTEEDIIYSAEQPRSYTPEMMLMRKFKLKEEEIEPYQEEIYHSVVEYALAHKEKIFKRSEDNRENYFKYIDKMGLESGKRYGVFDFVSSGTSQYDMSRVAPFEIEGLYACFYDIEKENRRKLPVRAMHIDNYPQNNSYTSYNSKTYLFENYVFLESVFTSPEPSVEGVNINGDLIYGEEHRSKAELNFMTETQKGIKDYFCDFLFHLYVENSSISMTAVDECYRYRELKYTNEHCKELDDLSVFEDLGYGKLLFPRK